MDTRTLLPFATVLLLSCSRTAPVADVAAGIERTVVEVAVSNGAPVTMADISIDGMSCEMMCGGSIKKALAKLPGVSGTEITFIEGDERDHAIVTYDERQVTDAQMIEAIQQLHDGQYKVLAVKITKQVPGTNTTNAEENGTDRTNAVSVISPAAIVLPGILSLLSHVLRL